MKKNNSTIHDLLQEALNVLEMYRGTVPPDKFKKDVYPVLSQIRDELAIIRINSVRSRTKETLISNGKEKNLPDFIDTPTLPEFMDTPVLKFEPNISSYPKTRPCKTDPKAPHGLLEELSKNMNRYVCKCEFWSPDL